jgi:type IV pilus assembly protein PilQ
MMRWNLAILSLCLGMSVSTPSFAQRSGSTVESRINAVGAFNVEEHNDGTLIRIGGSSVPTFSVFKLNDPPRLFIDISNSELSDDAQTVKVSNGVISQVAMLEFKDNIQSVTRVIIGFDSPAHYDVRTEGRDVVVFVDGTNRRLNNGVAQGVSADKVRELEARYQSDLTATQGKYSQAVSQLDATRNRLETAQRELSALQKQVSGTKGNEKNRVNAAIEAKNGELARVQADIKTRTKKVSELEGAVAEISRERDLLRESAKTATAQRDEALVLARQKELEGSKARQKADELAQNLEATRRDLDKVSKTSDGLKQKLSTANVRAQSASDEVTRARTELAQAQSREAELRKQVERSNRGAMSGDEAAKRELGRLEGEQKVLRDDLVARESQLARARTSAEDANVKLGEAQRNLSTRDDEIQRLRVELQASLTERDREVARANAAAQDRVSALEVALNDAKNKQDSGKTAERLADVERELKAARADVARLENKESKQVARAVPVEAANAVRGIRLENTGTKTRIVVELDRPGNFETLPWMNSRAVMILNGVSLPEALEKTLANGGEAGAVRFVSSYLDRQGSVRLEAELNGQATEVVRQEGNTLIWEFAAKAPEQDVAWDEEQSRPVQDGFTAAPPRYPSVVTDPTQVSTVPGMSRKRITIDLRGADIQNVLRLLAKEGGVNIVAGEGVGGEVTIRLRSVPLDEVFLTVLQARSLGFEKRGNVIRVAPQSVLLSEQTKRSEARAASERTKPLEVFLLPVNYADAKDMEAQVSSLLSPRGTVTVDARTNTLVIKDIGDNLAAVRALVESLDSQVPQVLIEARIVETNDTFVQSLGIQWGGDATWAQSNGNPTGLLFPSVLGISGGATDSQTPTAGTSSNPNFGVNLPTAVGTGSGGSIGLTMGSIGGAVNLNLRLTALEAAGHAKIVSSPKILTLDNTSATISQGTSIPVSVVSAAGVQTVFVDASIELKVTPHVTPDGNIQLKISASKNEPDFQNTGARGDPTIIRKQADTELLIKDGDTTVIGGIYTRNSGTSISAVPFFHKIPILGFFFRTQSESDRRTELLIFITPKIVNRAESIGQDSK